MRLIFLRRYLDSFNCFKGALDHLLIRTQFSRRSFRERLSWALRRSGRLKENRLNENDCRLSLPLRLSKKDRLWTGMGNTSLEQHPSNDWSRRFPATGMYLLTLSFRRIYSSHYSPHGPRRVGLHPFGDPLLHLVCRSGRPSTICPWMISRAAYRLPDIFQPDQRRAVSPTPRTPDPSGLTRERSWRDFPRRRPGGE